LRGSAIINDLIRVRFFTAGLETTQNAS